MVSHASGSLHCNVYCALCRSLFTSASRGRFQQRLGSVCALGRALPGLSARFAQPAKIQLAGWAATGSLALSWATLWSMGHPRRPMYGSEGSSSRSTISCAAAPGPMLAACRTPCASPETARGSWGLFSDGLDGLYGLGAL